MFASILKYAVIEAGG